jgi:two-component system cell cycle sensor histidine kinase/response regulator CckA
MTTEPTGEIEPLRGLGASILAAADRAGLGVLVRVAGDGPERDFVSGAAAMLLGYRPDQVSELSVDQVVVPQDLPKLECDDPADVDTGIVDLDLLRQDGTRLAVRIARTATKLGGQRATVGVVFDSAERHQAERALVTSEALYRRVIEAAPEPVLIAGPNGPVYANPAALRLVGMDRVEQLREPGVERAIHLDDLPLLKESARALKEARSEIQSIEIRLHREDGNTVHVEVLSMLTEWDGQPAILFLGRELSGRRELQAQLIQADRLAAVGTLAAGVAHEINNPLAYVLLNLQYLLRELPQLTASGERLEQLLDRLKEAQHGAERVSTIVRDLREFSSTDQEQIAAVDLRLVVAAAIKVAGGQIATRARLVESYEDVPTVRGNAAKLEQVFLNLLTNASQALPPGRPEHHEIRVALRADGPGRVTVEISDTGTGIPPELLDRVFDPFFTTKPAGVGTGLGLPICHNIVGSLGGEISVQSELGKGTSFRVSLRVMRAEPVSYHATPTPFAAVSPVPGRRGQVLVVDDELAVANMLSRLLSDEHDVEVRTTGQEALELLLGDRHFDVVMCDLLMPGMSGMALYEQLGAARPGLEQRLVFMTGGAFTQRAAEFLNTVDNPRVEKPFDVRKVRRLVRELARERSARDDT